MLGKAATSGKGWKIGPLQCQLRQGEYELFTSSPIFESNFVQISKQGGPIEIHNQEEIVTVGLTSTSPLVLIPNLMLLARPISPPEEYTPNVTNKSRHIPAVRYELTRLFPLHFVKITIHNLEKQQLRFKLVNGRIFYLQLCPEFDRQEDLFDVWIRIVQLLRPPSKSSLCLKKEKPRRTKRREAPPAQPSRGKSPSPQRAAVSKSKNKKNMSVRITPQAARAQRKDSKKSRAPVVPSESIASVQVMSPPPSAENIKAADRYQPPAAQKIAEKLEKAKTTNTELEKKEERGKGKEIPITRVRLLKRATPTLGDTRRIAFMGQEGGHASEY